MTYDNGVVTCKSRAPFFERERSGAKANTVRVVPVEEVAEVCRCRVIRVLSADSGEEFVRRISDISDITGIFPPEFLVGFRILCISWRP